MKKIFFTLALISIFSCSEDSNYKNTIYETSNEKSTYRLKPSDLEYMGIYHNEWMNDLFITLNENRDLLVEENSQTFIANFLGNKVRELAANDDVYKLGINLINKKIKTVTNRESLYTDKEKEILSPSVITYVDNLYNILMEENTELNLKLDFIKNLENDIYLDIANITKNEELTILFTATNVAKYSLNYWSENTDSWQIMLLNSETNSILTQDPGLLGRIVAADVASALGAAAGAWAVNLSLD